MSDMNLNLSEIFESCEDPAIEKTFIQLEGMAGSLCKKHQGKITEYNASQLLRLLKEYEEYLVLSEDLRVFIGMNFYINMLDEKAQSLYNKSQNSSAMRRKKLAFIQLEISELVLKKEELIQDSILENYKHLLEEYKIQGKHRLSELEEQLVIEKDQFGVSAWSDLQSKWVSTREFEFDIDGKKEKFHIGEFAKYRINEDRKIRKIATEAVYAKLSEDGELYSFVLRNIFNDWVTISKRRKYKTPIDDSLISNEVTKEMLDSMFSTIEKSVGLYHRGLKILEKLLGVPKLANYDIDAPLPNVPIKKYQWNEGKKIIIEAFSKFDKEFAQIAKDMFSRNHIDAAPRKGKAGGAFCASWYGGKSAFILQSYNDTITSVQTTAHELGHAIHDYLMSSNQTILNCRNPAVTAETASFFAELLLIEHLLENAETKNEKIDILMNLVKRIGHVIFGLTPMYYFETKLYEAVENGIFLDYKTISSYWEKERTKIYSEYMEFPEKAISSWSSVPHYYIPNFRYYNYPYIFAQLFVYAIYQQYRKDKEQFIPKFKKILTAGGSLSPEDLGKIVGLDITKAEFWKLGMKQYEFFVLELEKLLDEG